MIYLGYMSKGKGVTGTSTEPPDAGSAQKQTPDPHLAREQLECIQEFLTHVNFLFAWLLISKHPFGRFLEHPRKLRKFAFAEAKAMSISTSGILTIDKKAATSQRSGLKVTWIFDRLLDMAQSPIPIEIWETRGAVDASGQEGASYVSFR